MRGSHYTSEQTEWIVDHHPLMSYSELAKSFNERFGKSVTTDGMSKKCRCLGLPRKEHQYTSKFTDEANEWLRANAYNYTSADLSEKLCELFGIRVATQTVTWHLNSKLGIHRGNCFVPKNYQPRASKPIGSERIEKGRVVMVKVAQPNRWLPKAQVLMGYDPREFQPIFLDGNSLNVTKENIVVVSKKIHARLAKNGWLNSSNEVLMTGIKWSELFYAIKEIANE